MKTKEQFLRPIKNEIIGGHFHRSGWPYVNSLFEPLFNENEKLVFDDFLEKTIFNQRNGLDNYIHENDWVGICHYPFDVPFWYDTEKINLINKQESWLQSLENLRLCITLGEGLASWIRYNFKIPCVAIKHPTEIPNEKWTLDKFLNNDNPYLVQVGWYLRNTNAIYQIDVNDFLSKAWLRVDRKIANVNHELCIKNYANERKLKDNVEVLNTLSNNEYDKLLSENVVFIELISSVANNTIIECIARNTPIVLNRIPATEYYLGHEYPLFYDSFDELYGIVNIDNIIKAHQYLEKLDKGWLLGSSFISDFRVACEENIPEFLL